jgi:uncharacterized protein (TIGR02147 family)
MIRIFEISNYREYLTKRLKEMPNAGYGQMSELSRFIGVHTTLISQILKGHKDITTDQAILACEFFGLNPLESEYFVLLVNHERAGNPSSKRFYKNKLQKIREQSQDISQRVTADLKLSDQQRAVFYSDWAYSAIRQSVALPNINTVEDISRFLDIPIEKVNSYIHFLLHTGLCKLVGKKITVGPSSTHVESSSPWVNVHHVNWRNRAINSLNSSSPSDLHYTAPVTLSVLDCELIKERLIQMIQDVRSIVDPSPSEKMYCLNLDWFHVTKS